MRFLCLDKKEPQWKANVSCYYVPLMFETFNVSLGFYLNHSFRLICPNQGG
jgi:hypothetical protein